LARDSLTKRALLNPSLGKQASLSTTDRYGAGSRGFATGICRRVARAYSCSRTAARPAATLPARKTIAPAYRRQGWSSAIALQKLLGWTHGFLKEERHVFSPESASFGHAGLGGALGWCDPVANLTIGYAMNRLDWRVRSARALALCHALYECEPVRAR
jgi:CubicO group peptidase (beta-lactamase class C family)